ncbi:uncharacterized protein LOC124359186 [Homalodisca vitripennis]|uniref:uncharacterized protein LOC124359186 n=1 Tax=Homalodisca vitripennis TaxID=197043 RepID=UPI001EEAC58E|nr:uncharacterized protein LOC124359186 [Homalodisca vitripennis]
MSSKLCYCAPLSYLLLTFLFLHSLDCLATASPQDDDDSMDTDGFQEQFLLETPTPVEVEHRFRGPIAQLDDDFDEKPISPHIDKPISALVRPDHLKIVHKVFTSPEDEKGVADSKRREHPKLPELEKTERIDRLIGGVGGADEDDESKSKKVSGQKKVVDWLPGTIDNGKSTKQGPRRDDVIEIKIADGEKNVKVASGKIEDEKVKHVGTSPGNGNTALSPVSALDSKSPQPPTLELVIGRKEIRTREASATSESRLTLYTAHDVEISIRSQSHISLTTKRRDAGGKETSETVDVDTEIVSDEKDAVGEYIIPPEHTKERKREESVIFSGKKSIYTYDSYEGTSPVFDSPVTDESVSHHITDTGISITRGTATETITSTTEHVDHEIKGIISDTAVDVELEELELTDAGLSPIQPDDAGLPSSDITFIEEEMSHTKYCDVGVSPIEYLSESIALSPLQVATCEIAVLTDNVETRDAGVSPIMLEETKFENGLIQTRPKHMIENEFVLARRGSGEVKAIVKLLEEQSRIDDVTVLRDQKKKEEKDGIVIQIDRNDESSKQIITPKKEDYDKSAKYRQTDSNIPSDDVSSTTSPAHVKTIGPKIKQLQKIFTQSVETETDDEISDIDNQIWELSYDESHSKGVIDVTDEETADFDDEGKDEEPLPQVHKVIESIEKRIATQSSLSINVKRAKEVIESKTKELETISVGNKLTEVLKAEENILLRLEKATTSKLDEHIFKEQHLETVQSKPDQKELIENGSNLQYKLLEILSSEKEALSGIDEAITVTEGNISVPPCDILKSSTVDNVSELSVVNIVHRDVIRNEKTVPHDKEISADNEVPTNKIDLVPDNILVNEPIIIQDNIVPAESIDSREVKDVMEKTTIDRKKIETVKSDKRKVILTEDLKKLIDEENELQKKQTEQIKKLPKLEKKITQSPVLEETIVPKKISWRENESLVRSSEKVTETQKQEDLSKQEKKKLDLDDNQLFTGESKKLASKATEIDVKVLMSEVKEFTRQIKEEVRELKPDLTPTPDGKDIFLHDEQSKTDIDFKYLSTDIDLNTLNEFKQIDTQMYLPAGPEHKDDYVEMTSTTTTKIKTDNVSKKKPYSGHAIVGIVHKDTMYDKIDQVERVDKEITKLEIERVEAVVTEITKAEEETVVVDDMAKVTSVSEIDEVEPVDEKITKAEVSTVLEEKPLLPVVSDHTETVVEDVSKTSEVSTLEKKLIVSETPEIERVEPVVTEITKAEDEVLLEDDLAKVTSVSETDRVEPVDKEIAKAEDGSVSQEKTGLPESPAEIKHVDLEIEKITDTDVEAVLEEEPSDDKVSDQVETVAEDVSKIAEVIKLEEKIITKDTTEIEHVKPVVSEITKAEGETVTDDDVAPGKTVTVIAEVEPIDEEITKAEVDIILEGKPVIAETPLEITHIVTEVKEITVTHDEPVLEKEPSETKPASEITHAQLVTKKIIKTAEDTKLEDKLITTETQLEIERVEAVVTEITKAEVETVVVDDMAKVTSVSEIDEVEPVDKEITKAEVTTVLEEKPLLPVVSDHTETVVEHVTKTSEVSTLEEKLIVSETPEIERVEPVVTEITKAEDEVLLEDDLAKVTSVSETDRVEPVDKEIAKAEDGSVSREKTGLPESPAEIKHVELEIEKITDTDGETVLEEEPSDDKVSDQVETVAEDVSKIAEVIKLEEENRHKRHNGD